MRENYYCGFPQAAKVSLLEVRSALSGLSLWSWDILPWTNGSVLINTTAEPTRWLIQKVMKEGNLDVPFLRGESGRVVIMAARRQGIYEEAYNLDHVRKAVRELLK